MILDFLTFTILMSVFSWYMWSCRSSLSVSQTHTAFIEPVYHCCKTQKHSLWSDRLSTTYQELTVTVWPPNVFLIWINCCLIHCWFNLIVWMFAINFNTIINDGTNGPNYKNKTQFVINVSFKEKLTLKRWNNCHQNSHWEKWSNLLRR